MPRMDEAAKIEEEQLIKLLLIGDGKCGKTHFAGMAAAAGFNVLYIDGDVGRQTLATLPAEARKRIYLMNFADNLLQGQRTANMWENWREFSSTVTFKWNDSQSQLSRPKTDKVGDELWSIRPAAMDASCVLVLDSWTSLTESIMLTAAQAYSVDLASATTSEMRPVYQSAGLKATQAMQIIRAMKCHVICIAHPDEYSHTTKPDGRKVKDIKETDLVVDWTKMIPKSTSKPHGLQMPKYFTDIAWMVNNATGSQRLLDFRVDEGKVCGGHFTDRKNTEEYSFANLVKVIGGAVPKDASVDSWLTISQVSESSSQSSAPPVLNGEGKPEIKQAGLAAFMKKPVVAG